MWNKEEVQAAFQKIIKRAMTDKSFRELCLKDAAKAIKEETGEELPSGFTVKFVENQGADATFVLPNFKESPDELDDKELDTVAGGIAKCNGESCEGVTKPIGGVYCGGVSCCIGNSNQYI